MAAAISDRPGNPASRRERMLRAAQGEPVDRPPVWLMRQAGRYLPEYRAIRERASFLEMCRDPDLAAEVSLQPYERFGVDAVIVFSDILLPLAGIGLDLDFDPSPRVANPVQGSDDVERLEGDPAGAMAPTCEAIRRLRASLGDDVPILGFAGAPWTLAAYASETRLSRDLVRLRALVHEDPPLLDRLLDRLADVTARTLEVQIEAGADLVQVFDTWAGLLHAGDYRRFAGRAVRRVLDRLGNDAPPVILFARAGSHLVDEMASLGPAVLSVDWRTDLADVAARLGRSVSLQGNLDPAALFGSPEGIRKRVRGIVEAGRGARGHIVNLGHGIYPTTPVAGVAAFVDAVQKGPEETP